MDPAIEAECARLSAVERLDEIPGIGAHNAQVIIAEIGLDMSRFPTPEHLVSWAKLCPRTIQSGPRTRAGKTGKGNPYLKGALGEAAAAAAKTDTFLGERYRRLVKRRGKLKALVAVARSILVIIWHLLADPAARFHDLGPDYHATRIDIERRHPQPRPPARRPRLPGHPRTRRLTQIHSSATYTGLRKLRRVLSRAHSPGSFSGQSPGLIIRPSWVQVPPAPPTGVGSALLQPERAGKSGAGIGPMECSVSSAAAAPEQRTGHRAACICAIVVICARRDQVWRRARFLSTHSRGIPHGRGSRSSSSRSSLASVGVASSCFIASYLSGSFASSGHM